MTKNNYIIRLEKNSEHYEVENLVREAFWNVYRPGCLEHYVLHKFRNNSDFIPELDLVMEKENGEIIGQSVSVRAIIKSDNGKHIPVITIGPICIRSEYQRNGLGKILLDYSLKKAKEFGYGAVCLEGDINFYGNSGFTYASNYGIRYHGLPDEADSSFFLCKELISGYFDGVTGEYSTPQGYFVDDSEVEIFDQKFRQKIKKKIPGQIF